MGIERLVFACCKIGIDKDRSGGQTYSYTQGMNKLWHDENLRISDLADYKRPDEPTPYTYKQLDTVFPKQLRYKAIKDGKRTLFAFSNNKPSIDWDAFENYAAYLEASRDENAVVKGRSGAAEFYILAGESDELSDFPCRYYQSESLIPPYTGENFCSLKKPGYMQPLESLVPGNTITKEGIRQFLTEESGRVDILKRMAYCMLRYKSDAGYAKNIVICDEHEKIIDWIAALTFLLSESLAKSVSFSTYEYSPVGAGYRICGAYLKGTDYRPNASNETGYVFDILNDKLEEVDVSESELYGFLVNSFLYAPDSLEKFYDFVEKFAISEVSVEMEDAFELYRAAYLNKDNQITDVNWFRKIADFAKHCTDETEIKSLLVNFIRIYVEAETGKKDECREILTDLIGHFPGQLAYLEQLCADELADMLEPSRNITVERLQTEYEEYEQLFQKSGGKLFPAYYKAFLQKADAVLSDGADLLHNRYIVEIIYRYIRENKLDISNILSSSHTEGKMLKKIVGNIVRLNVSESELSECIRQLLKPYEANPRAYLYLIRALKEMAYETYGGSVQLWTDILDRFITELIMGENSGQAMQIYDALIEMGYEESVSRDIVRRSEEKTEPFALLLADIKALLARYKEQFQPNEMYRILIKAAENKDDPQQNLRKILELLLASKESNTLTLEVADKFVGQMDLSAGAADKAFIDKLIALYKEYDEPNAKLDAVSLLQQMDAELEAGRKSAAKKYGQLIPPKTLEFPNVSEEIGHKFLEEFGSKIVELYFLCEEIRAVHYYNNLFVLSDMEQQAFMEYELRLAADGGKKQNIAAVCRLIAYSIITKQQPQSDEMAKILSESKININKMDKCFDEKNKDFLKEIYKEINLPDTSEQDRKELLIYWNDVSQTVNAKNPGFMKKFMSTFFNNKG